MRFVAVVAAAAVGLAGVAGWWWRGRGERALAEASARLEAGEVDAALEALTTAEAVPGSRDRALLLRARVAVESGDLAGAVRALDGVKPDGPESAGFAYWKGRTLYAAGQPRLAVPWFQTARRHRADDADAARWLGVAAYDLGDRSTAVAALQDAAALAPKDARLWRTLGLIYQENVEHQRARDAFGRCLALDRAQPHVRLELAESLLDLGDAAAAIAELERCRGPVSEGRRAELLARALRDSGSLEPFREAVAAGLKAEPNRPGLLALRAQLEQSDGKAAEALALLDRALAADPYKAAYFYQRSLVQRQLGRDENARADADRAQALNRTLAAMSALNDEAARDPLDAGVRFRLGKACAELGKFELAASWYRAALACDPNHEPSRRALAALGAPARRSRLANPLSP